MTRHDMWSDGTVGFRQIVRSNARDMRLYAERTDRAWDDLTAFCAIRTLPCTASRNLTRPRVWLEWKHFKLDAACLMLLSCESLLWIQHYRQYAAKRIPN